MLNRLNIILEDINNDVKVYKNPDGDTIHELVSYVERAVNESALRFFMNHNGDYLVWIAVQATHKQVLSDKSIKDITEGFKANDLRGQIFIRGTHLYGTFAYPFYNTTAKSAVINKFKESPLYKALEEADIKDVELGIWM